MATTLEKTKPVSFLEERKIRIVPIKRNNPFPTFSLEEFNPRTAKYETKKDIPEQFNNTYKLLSVPLDRVTGLTRRILSNKKVDNIHYDEKISEQEFFERELGLNPGDLDPEKKFYVSATNQNVRYNNWNTNYTTVKLYNYPIDLDLSKAVDMLKFKVIQENSHIVAKTPDDQNSNPRLTHYIIDLEAHEKIKATNATKKFVALEELMKIKNKVEEVSKYVSLLTEKWYESKDLESSFAKLFNMVEDNPDKFMKIVNDVNKDARLFIYQGVKKGEIVVRNGVYTTVDGIKLGNLMESISWYNENENFATIEKMKQRFNR
jgi:hypothetical protein